MSDWQQDVARIQYELDALNSSEHGLAALYRLAASIEELERERDHWHEEYRAACASLVKRVHQGANAVRERDEAREALRRIADNCDAWQGQVAREALDGPPADPEPRPPADQDTQP